MQLPFNLKDTQETEGFLFRLERGIAKNWKRRWVILFEKNMYYFKGKPKKGRAELQGVCPLEDARIIEVDAKDRPHSFAVENPSRTWWFQAESALSKKEWLISLSSKVNPETNNINLQFDEKDVLTGLKQVYRDHLEDLEKEYLFSEFHSAPMKGVDFDAKPLVLLIGQYSVGKTSFIEFMLQQPFPGQRIGPEPTTDRFVAVMHDENERVIPGSAIAIDPEKPFNTLNSFGSGFLSRFEGALSNAELLKSVTFIDTPGILSGSKQRENRSYDFVEIIEWFAERSDMILLLFDAYKLDISDEFRDAIEVVAKYHDKIRVVLNKASQISPSKLMKVYGALMWSLGKVITTPEVLRVYIGSFWLEEKVGPYTEQLKEWLFDSERDALLKDIFDLKRNATTRKVDSLVRRIRMLQTHICILDYVREKMPSMFGQKKVAKDLTENIEDHYEEIARLYDLPLGDFPSPKIYRNRLPDFDLKKLPKIHSKTLAIVKEILERDLPRLILMVTSEVEYGEELYFDL